MTTFLDQTQDYNPHTGDIQLNPAAWGLSLQDINSAASIELRSSLYAGNANLTADQYREVQELVKNKYSGVDYTGMIKGTGMLSDISMLGRDPGLYMNQERFGYWKNDTDQWQAYIGNNGNFAFQGDANNYISWNGSELVIRGSIFLEDGTSITDMNNTFYQDSEPTTFTDGDIWFDTNDGNKMYLSVLGVWTSVQDTLAIGLANTAQATADGKAKVYYQTSAPVLTPSDIGDLWVDTDDGNKITTWNGTAWVSTSNSDALNALAAASTAQATADGKIESFYQPTAPSVASEGDIWFDTDDGNKIYTRRSGSWVVTQDSLIAQAINNAQTAQTTADGKAKVYYQTTAPVLGAGDIGDLWVDTDNLNRIATWNGTAWVSVSNDDAIAALAAAATAQSTADGKIDTFYQTTAPTVASEGDIWFDTDDGNKIYTRRSGVWVVTQDSKIAQAINDAQTAQTTADGKARVYYQTTAPVLTASDIGDLWVDTDDNNKVTTWNGTAWVSTSNTDARTALANAATAQATADGKIVTFYQASAPTVAGEGDIWFDTDDGNKMYTRRSGSWVNTQDTKIGDAITAAAGAQATADGKITTFYLPTSTPPTAEGIGDLWYDTITKVITRWSGSAWVNIRDIGATKADTALDSDSRYTKWLESNLITETKTKTGYTGVILDNDGIGGYTSGTATFRIDRTTGAAYYSGSVTAGGLDVGTAGNIRGGQTAYNTGSGFFLGYSGAAHKISIGNGTKGFTWDGTNATIRGNLYAESGTFTGSITSTATITGGILQSATSGKRIVIESNTFRSYDSSDVLRVQTADNGLRVTEATGSYYADISSGYFTIAGTPWPFLQISDSSTPANTIGIRTKFLTAQDTSGLGIYLRGGTLSFKGIANVVGNGIELTSPDDDTLTLSGNKIILAGKVLYSDGIDLYWGGVKIN